MKKIMIMSAMVAIFVTIMFVLSPLWSLFFNATPDWGLLSKFLTVEHVEIIDMVFICIEVFFAIFAIMTARNEKVA